VSTHSIEIIEIGEITSHPNADKLCITHVDGWQCCIAKDQFKVGDKAVYIEPDYLVPLSHPAFSFLKKDESKTVERIRVRRLRGQLSQGLLIPVPPELADLPVGTNVIDQLGIERYEAPLPASTGGMFVGGPSGVYAPKFDVENYQKFMCLFEQDEPVVITEKLHGANARFTYAQDKDGQWVQYCGSRTNWMGEDDKNIWWHAFRQCPAIGEWCRDNPEKIVYGEVFGNVQSLKYGAKPNTYFFAAFAVLDKGQWVDFAEAYQSTQSSEVPWAPILYRGPFNKEKALACSEGPSTWPGAQNIREGCVVVPEKERMDAKVGRVMLKIVSNVYLEKH